MVNRLISSVKRKTIKSLKWIIPISFMIVIIYEFDEMFSDFNWQLFEFYYDRLSVLKIIVIFSLGFIALFPMFFYDFILTKLFNIQINKKSLLYFSLSANAYSNFVGFGGVAGATLRTYYYQRYVQNDLPFIRTIAKLSLFYLTGLSILCWIIMFQFLDSFIFLELPWLKTIVLMMSLYTPIFTIVLVSIRTFWGISKLNKHYFIELIVTSLFEWLFVVVWIWGITELLVVPVTFTQLFPIVVISSCAGIISMIPGGIGTFDFIFLTGLELYDIPTELSLLILLFYRISYYVIPFILGTPLAISTLIQKWKYRR